MSRDFLWREGLRGLSKHLHTRISLAAWLCDLLSVLGQCFCNGSLGISQAFLGSVLDVIVKGIGCSLQPDGKAMLLKTAFT